MKILKYLTLLCTAFVLLACGSVDIRPPSKDGVTAPEPSAAQLAGDMPIPPGSTVRPQETLVMGTGNRWMGRISLSVPGESQAIYTYYRDGLPSAGWVLTSSSYSKLSFLTFSKAERVATVQIQSASFGGNEVTITVTPATKPGNVTP
ncbi:MAG: hypothetical protein Q7U05_02380 [Polaromonas sp.]|nr:hypothetical protein [Polaromonas sp.]